MAVCSPASSGADNKLGPTFFLHIKQQGKIAPDHINVTEHSVRSQVIRTWVSAPSIDSNQIKATPQRAFHRRLRKAVSKHPVRQHDEFIVFAPLWIPEH